MRCSLGTSSLFGSNGCSQKNWSYEISVIFPLTEFEFTPSLQFQYVECIAIAAGVSTDDVTIVSFAQAVISNTNSTRRLLQTRTLNVRTRISTIDPVSQFDYDFLGNKSALDALFQERGLPESLALGLVVSCEAGFVLLNDKTATVCSQCPWGTFSSMLGQVTACHLCAKGEYTSSAGSTSCLTYINGSATSTDSSKLSVGGIVGYSFGGFAVLLLLIFGLTMCFTCSRSGKPIQTQIHNGSDLGWYCGLWHASNYCRRNNLESDSGKGVIDEVNDRGKSGSSLTEAHAQLVIK